MATVIVSAFDPEEQRKIWALVKGRRTRHRFTEARSRIRLFIG
jgi:hypothetical protein